MSEHLHSTPPALSVATVLPRHPLGEGFNALTCPTCGDRCGHLFDGVRCLACEVGWTDPQFPAGVETDILGYRCECGRQWPVLIEREQGGEWLIVHGEDEACPDCRRWGSCLEDEPEPAEEEDEDPDYWTWHGHPSLTAGERNR